MIRIILSIISFLFVPIVFLSLKSLGATGNIFDYYTDWNDYRKSGESWGYFD